MKSKTLLLLVMTSFIIVANAQKREKPITGYAITAVEKGGRNWKEVRLVDVVTGQEVQSIYKSGQQVEALNARTGKPVVKKEMSGNGLGVGKGIGVGNASGTTTFTVNDAKEKEKRKVVNLDDELDKANGKPDTKMVIRKTFVVVNQKIQMDQPFSTNSAA